MLPGAESDGQPIRRGHRHHTEATPMGIRVEGCTAAALRAALLT